MIKQRLSLGFLLFVATPLSFASECKPPEPQPGDWKTEISSEEYARYMLSMELAQSLKAIEKCTKNQLATQEDPEREMQAKSGVAGAGENETEPMADAEDNEEETSGGREAHEGSKKTARNEKNREDYVETELASDEGLEPILREAIEAEKDPFKREILRERYRLLVGKDPPK
jgi:hypothetical protein